MQAFGTPFGAFGTAVYGRDPVAYVADCPVPAGVAGIFFTAEEHDGWCNCVYGAVPGLNALCKIKIGDKLPNGDTFLDPTMPWTVTGKRTRGLTDDALGKLLQGLMQAAGKAVIAGENAIGGALGLGPIGTPVVGSAPAGPGGPLSTQASLDNSRNAFLATAQGSPVTARGGAAAAAYVNTGWSPVIANTPQNQMLVAGAVAFGVWYFLIREPSRSVSGFGGYRRRRSHRRLRLR